MSLGSVVVFTGLGLLFVMGGRPAAKCIGYIVGEIRQHSGEALPRLHMTKRAVHSHDQIRTPAHVTYRVQFENGRYLEIPPSTTVRLDAVKDQTVELGLIAGTMPFTGDIPVIDASSSRSGNLLAFPMILRSLTSKP